MDTSDESFAWTDASSDSSKDIMPIEMNQNKSKKGSEEYGAELQVTDQLQKTQRGKKRKKHAIQEDTDNCDLQIDRSIKSETSSDFEVSKSNKRHKNKETSISSNYNDSLHDAEDYLNFRVKQEQASFIEPTPVKSKKKKKSKVEHEKIEDHEFEISTPYNNKIDIEEQNLDFSSIVNGESSEISEIDVSYKKKKKKQKRLLIDNDTKEMMENPEINHRIINKKRVKDKLYEDSNDGNLHDEEELHNSENCIEDPHNVDNYSPITSSTFINKSVQDKAKEQSTNEINRVSTLLNSTESSSAKSGVINEFKKESRISDRIRFEDESVDYELNKYVPKDNISTQLKQFISSNTNLTALHANLHSDPVLGEDDEVWIVKGPHEITIEDFKNTKLTLDNKRKVKINGNAYDSIIDNRSCAVPILLYNNNKVDIKNIPLTGIIHLRKRIPKVHIPYESLMMNNESSFIPLPDTKCRHPLFGINYRKTTRIPLEVAERLNTSYVLVNKEKKKKKKHKIKNNYDMIESDKEMKPYIEGLHSKKKNKESSEIESDIDMKLNAEESDSNKNKTKKERFEIESETEVKPNISVLHSSKKKKKIKDETHEIESNIELLDSKKKKRKTKEIPDNVSDSEVKPSIDVLLFNKKKRKHSDEKRLSKKAKRETLGTSGADAWESEQAIEKNLFDF